MYLVRCVVFCAMLQTEGKGRALMDRYFPSIVKAVNSDEAVLHDCVVSSGVMHISTHLLSLIDIEV